MRSDSNKQFRKELSERTWLIIPVLAAVAAISTGLAINTSLQLENTKAELQKALTSTDEYVLAIGSQQGHVRDMSVLNWPSLNVTSLTVPITIEVILPQGIDHITLVNRDRLADTTSYSIRSNGGYPEEDTTTITFNTISADHFDIYLGQKYASKTSGTVFVTVWVDGEKVGDPRRIFMASETEFAIHFDLITTN